MPESLTHQEIAEIRDTFDKTGNRTETARQTGRSRSLVFKYTKDLKTPQQAGPVGGKTSDFREAEDGTAVATAVSDTPVRTLEDAIRVAGVDTKVWYVSNWESTAWSVGMKVRGADGRDRVVKSQQHRVKLVLKRIAPRAILEALDIVYDRLAAVAPKGAKLRKPEPNLAKEDHLGVVALFDAHFGKLAWGPEVGNSYDLGIAEQVYRRAVIDLIGESAGRRIGQWLLPIGNDFFHMDNSRNQTFNGTPQDVDGRYAKVIAAGELAVIWAIDRLRKTAPVTVIWVPGNHDPTTSYHLARTVKAWFRNDDDVKVSLNPSPRKYFHWKSTLLGFTHGNEEKPSTLPSLMATERPEEWAASKCREWLLGHHHRTRAWVTQPSDTFEGTTVRVIRSLAGTDAWHHRKGYVGDAQRAAEVYWYGEKRGYAGHAVAPARQCEEG